MWLHFLTRRAEPKERGVVVLNLKAADAVLIWRLATHCRELTTVAAHGVIMVVAAQFVKDIVRTKTHPAHHPVLLHFFERAVNAGFVVVLPPLFELGHQLRHGQDVFFGENSLQFVR